MSFYDDEFPLLLASVGQPVPEREVVRCTACRLNQFMTMSGDCRRCGKSLPGERPRLPEPDPEPELKPAYADLSKVVLDESYIRTMVTDYDEVKNNPCKDSAEPPS